MITVKVRSTGYRRWHTIEIPVSVDRLKQLRRKYKKWFKENEDPMYQSRFAGIFMNEHCKEYGSMNGFDQLSLATAVTANHVKYEG